MNAIDFHTHAFSPKVVKKAIAGLAHAGGALTPHYDGTPDGLLGAMDKSGVDISVVLNIATSGKSESIINDFAAEVNKSDRLVGFGSVHPLSDTAMAEIDRLCALGLKGVKLHPDYQQFYADDERACPVYEKLGEKGLIVSFHSGVDIGLSPPVYCSPERLARALPYLKGAKVVAAHFGAYLQWEGVLEHLCGKELYFDTSFSCGKIPPRIAREIIKNHGADKMLLGSDGPWSDCADEINLIKSLELSKKDENKILYENAAALLSISL